jgi:hypothetical protein
MAAHTTVDHLQHRRRSQSKQQLGNRPKHNTLFTCNYKYI